MPHLMKSTKTTNSTRRYARPLFVAKVALVSMPALILTSAVVSAQQADVAPEIVARMARRRRRDVSARSKFARRLQSPPMVRRLPAK